MMMASQGKVITTVILGGERTGKTALVKKVSLSYTARDAPCCEPVGLATAPWQS